MKRDLDPLQTRLRVLADASRFRILRLLQAGTQHVGAVATAVGLSQSCTTRHLQVLERAALVVRTPRGRQVQVALSSEARALLAALAGGASTGGADVHSDARAARADGASAGHRRPAARRPREPVTRATGPASDTPPASPSATHPPAAPPVSRSRLEEFLL